MKILRLLYAALVDGIVFLGPQYKPLNGYAFLVHPRDTRDIHRKYPFLKPFGESATLAIVKWFLPVRVAPIRGLISQKTGLPIEGWVIACPLTAHQMMHDRALASKSIVKAARLAQRHGARIIGLGALTASLSRGGLDIVEKLDIEVTTGRVYTVKSVTDIAIHAAAAVGIITADARVAIVGAAGSIGAGSAQVLAQYGFMHIHLVDLSEKTEDITLLKNEIIKLNPTCVVTVSNNIDSIADADIIIAATSHPDALIMSRHLKRGAIVVDDAQPSDVDESIIDERHDVLILQGGVVHSNFITIPFHFGLKEWGDIFSCLAEVLVVAATDREKGSGPGRFITLDFALYRELSEAGKQLGFTRGSFQNVKNVYTKEDMARIKAIRMS